jgi:hypothetical protein
MRWDSLTAYLVEFSGHNLESSQTRVFVWFSTLDPAYILCYVYRKMGKEKLPELQNMKHRNLERNTTAKIMEILSWWSETIYHLSMFTRIQYFLKIFAAINVHLFIYFIIFPFYKMLLMNRLEFSCFPDFFVGFFKTREESAWLFLKSASRWESWDCE